MDKGCFVQRLHKQYIIIHIILIKFVEVKLTWINQFAAQAHTN